MISFATSNGLTVSSTTFPHKDIHKATWRSSDDETLNQIDHVPTKTRYRSIIYDVRIHRGADCDTNHYLVIAKLRSKLKKLLKDETVRKEYENEVMMNLKENNVCMNANLDWEKVSNAVKKAAAKSIDKRRKARDDFIENNTQMTKVVFIWERKKCKSAVQRER
ncbi:craniofacial development protein 2-like [Daktulosphaira vitifoliae]|uniref:craniofacial development protein 2-like n=1 Tax=Daktulosphaira vitifoliae TaxID=58002 RepID=UPI0021AA2156|nr:craniofacial development protein 2-like [Daktulosphaira vitifoliae]